MGPRRLSQFSSDWTKLEVEVLGSVAIILGSSPHCGPLMKLATAPLRPGQVPKLIETGPRTGGDVSPCRKVDLRSY